MKKSTGFSREVLILILVSAFVRALLALFLELGNDEVYYWTYALYPDLSHFDHPPMVGWFIQVFTLNLLVDSELALRMASILVGSLNIYLFYLIGKAVMDELAGWYAALLYTASIYCFLITGTFILPDTPQSLYWIMSLYFLITAFSVPRAGRMQLLLAGFSIGLAMLSKYTSVFLWAGALLYIMLYDRKWLKSGWLYASMIISLLFFLPVIIWNINSDFISFTYQGERVGIFGSGINMNYFLREVSGQLLYNNPVNVLLIIIALIAIFKKKIGIDRPLLRIILLTSIPLIFTFLFFSLFRSTLPHWTGPAYYGLILLAAIYLRMANLHRRKMFPNAIRLALAFLSLVIILGMIQVNFGLLYSPGETEARDLGKRDVSLDIYGWRQIGESFREIRKRDLAEEVMAPSDPMVSYRWFPAANLDYYVARPAGINMLAIGSLERIHKYAWINHYRGGFSLGMSAYYITTSRDFADPREKFGDYFESVGPPDTIRIYRNRELAAYAFLYRLYGMKKTPGPLTGFPAF